VIAVPLPHIDDELWTALGDPTRRRILDLLLDQGPASASSLGRELPVTRQAVAKHLAVLDRAGLVTSGQAGREVRYGVDAAQFSRACAQLAAVGEAWDGRLRRIRLLAEALHREGGAAGPPD
jgi:DNA-binding transcriptional ArsR family regulator